MRIISHIHQNLFVFLFFRAIKFIIFSLLFKNGTIHLVLTDLTVHLQKRTSYFPINKSILFL